MIKKIALFVLLLCGGSVYALQPTTPDKIDRKTILNLLDTSLPGMEKVGEALSRGDYDAAAEAYLEYRRKVSKAVWRLTPVPPSAKPSDKTEAWADSVCMHYIKDYLNPKPYINGAFHMGEGFDWFANPRTKDDPAYSREWTVAVVGRMKFVEQLCTSYRNTLNEKYLRKATWLVDDFISENMIGGYVGKSAASELWRTLDVSIRGNALLNSYFTIRDCAAFTAADQANFAIMVYTHASRLCSVLLADTVRTGNWVTTECNGLFNLAVMFPEFKEAGVWQKSAVDRFMYEIARVVPPDGLQGELSPSYHYGAVSGYSTIYEIARMNNVALPDGFASKLISMYRAPVLIMDQDGGFVKTNDSNSRNIRQISKTGYDLTKDPMLAWAASRGLKGLQPPVSTVLPYAGFYMMRSSWKPGGLFLFFRAGPEGIAHSEQDMLQVVLKAWGQTLLFDPGKYNYDQSEWRRYAINTAAHNTIIVDGKWQNREKQPLGEFVPVGNPYAYTPMFDFVSGCYDKGYQTNVYDPTKDYRPQVWLDDRDTSVVHTRRVIYLKPHYALVLDELTGSGEHTFDAHFHIEAPDAAVDGQSQSVVSRRQGDVQIALFPLDVSNLTTEVIKGQREPMLGWMPIEHRPTPTARFRKTQQTPAHFATFLYPYNGKAPEFKASAIPVAGESCRAYSLDTGKEICDIYVSRNDRTVSINTETPLAGKVDASANLLIIRSFDKGKSVYVCGWNVTSYSDHQLSFRTSQDSKLVAYRKGRSVIVYNGGDRPMELIVEKPFSRSVVIMPGKWNRISSTENEAIDDPQIIPAFN